MTMADTGNFEMGESLVDVRCRYGHRTRLFNIGRGHFVACDVCRSYVFVGANLMSGWRQEDARLWHKNYSRVKRYRFFP